MTWTAKRPQTGLLFTSEYHLVHGCCHIISSSPRELVALRSSQDLAAPASPGSVARLSRNSSRGRGLAPLAASQRRRSLWKLSVKKKLWKAIALIIILFSSASIAKWPLLPQSGAGLFVFPGWKPNCLYACRLFEVWAKFRHLSLDGGGLLLKADVRKIQHGEHKWASGPLVLMQPWIWRFSTFARTVLPLRFPLSPLNTLISLSLSLLTRPPIDSVSVLLSIDAIWPCMNTGVHLMPLCPWTVLCFLDLMI